jgi:tetratricopeptide (TPR) repeat protein
VPPLVLSFFLTAVGRTEESLTASRRCLELDPLDLVINIHMAWHYQFARQYEQAVEQCWKTSELHPHSLWPAYFFGLAFEQQGQIDRAAEELQIAVKMSGDVTFASAALGHLYATVGKVARSAGGLQRVERPVQIRLRTGIRYRPGLRGTWMERPSTG